MERYTFSMTQLEQYFDRIALPKTQRTLAVSTLDSENKLAYLTTLLKHHIVRIPFENLVQHYSWHRVIDIHPLHLHRKIISQPGRGGYCLEANTLFHNVLRALGFHCYLAAGRVWEPHGSWTGWSHVINIVMLDGKKYLCDVGFGPKEPLRPMLLVDGETSKHISPAEVRLVYQTLPQNLSDAKLWVYQWRPDANKDWMMTYCFSEMELLPGDLEGLNYAPWIGRASHFTQKVICVRYSLSNESDDEVDGLPVEVSIAQSEIDGSLIVNQDNFKWRRHGEDIIDRDFKDEDDRVETLRKYFGIELDFEDRRAITGSVSALKSKR